MHSEIPEIWKKRIRMARRAHANNFKNSWKKARRPGIISTGTISTLNECPLRTCRALKSLLNQHPYTRAYLKWDQELEGKEKRSTLNLNSDEGFGKAIHWQILSTSKRMISARFFHFCIAEMVYMTFRWNKKLFPNPNSFFQAWCKAWGFLTLSYSVRQKTWEYWCIELSWIQTVCVLVTN